MRSESPGSFPTIGRESTEGPARRTRRSRARWLAGIAAGVVTAASAACRTGHDPRALGQAANGVQSFARNLAAAVDEPGTDTASMPPSGTDQFGLGGLANFTLYDNSPRVVHPGPSSRRRHDGAAEPGRPQRRDRRGRPGRDGTDRSNDGGLVLRAQTTEITTWRPSVTTRATGGRTSRFTGPQRRADTARLDGRHPVPNGRHQARAVPGDGDHSQRLRERQADRAGGRRHYRSGPVGLRSNN